MSGPIATKLGRHRLGATVLGLLAALLLAVPATAAACEEAPESTGPVITEAHLTPANVPFEGGTGAISVRVEDDCAVQQVYVEINSTEGTYISFELLPSEEDINTNHRLYKGEFQIPANFQEWEVGWQVSVFTQDIDGIFAEAYAGEINQAGVPQFDEDPWVSDPRTFPTVWGGSGGTSTITVEAGDNRGLANVYAIVKNPDSSEREIPMEGLTSSLFVGSLKLPANPEATPRGYSVAVYAEDDIGQTTGAFAGMVTVEPKGTPNPGFLTLEPGFLRFGSNILGQSTRRSVVLRNPGKPGSPPVSGFLRSSDPQFFLPGPSNEGLPFTLAPGEEQEIEVGFQPDLKGQQTGRLSLVRDDGRQPNTGVSLFGWGVR